MADTAGERTIYLVGHAHIDLGYRWKWNETVHRVARDTFRGVLRMMDEYPELTFVQSQLAIYEAMAEFYPDLFRQIKERIAEGRWIVTDGWCEYDHTMPSGESMVRQHLLGSRYAREELGVDVRMAWAPDAFSGHVHTLPTILKGCGFDYLLFGRGMPDEMPFFWWEGPDGSQVLSYTPVYGYNADIGPQILEHLDRWQELTGMNARLTLYGRGDHGGGPREEDLQDLQIMRETEPDLRLEHTTPERFFREVLLAQPEVPVHRGELGGGSTGSLTSEARNKEQNRLAETMLLTAERFATISVFFQRKPVYDRVDFREAWKVVLRHQFHDELPGTSRAGVFEDNAADYDVVMHTMASTLHNALAEIGARVDTRGPGTPVMVFNPLSWPRSEPVTAHVRLPKEPGHLAMRDAQDRTVPVQVVSTERRGPFWDAEVLLPVRDVPPMGYALIRLDEERKAPAPEEPLSVSASTLENAYLRVEVNRKTGRLERIYDKRSDRESLAAPGASLQVIGEQTGAASAWRIVLTDEVEELDDPESVGVVERGPVRGIIRSAYRFRDSVLVQDVILHAGLARVDVRLGVYWYERDRCLKAAVPADVDGGEATFEVPFGHIVRPADGTEAPAQNWVDVSDDSYGVSLLTNSRYGFDVRDNVMRMTVLRGINDLDPRADEGYHEVQYAILPHAEGWREAKTVRRGMEFNLQMLAQQELRRAGIVPPWTSRGVLDAMPPAWSFLTLEPDSVVLTALKVEEEEWGQGSPFIVRLQETEGRATEAILRLPITLAHCEETNHIEDAIESEDVRWAGDTVSVRMAPYSVKTLRLRLSAMTLGINPDKQGAGDVGVFSAGDEGRLREQQD